jgi:hypothetical protein
VCIYIYIYIYINIYIRVLLVFKNNKRSVELKYSGATQTCSWKRKNTQQLQPQNKRECSVAVGSCVDPRASHEGSLGVIAEANASESTRLLERRIYPLPPVESGESTRALIASVRPSVCHTGRLLFKFFHTKIRGASFFFF